MYDLNTDVLGYLIETWSKNVIRPVSHNRIFDPLGLKDTYFYLPKEKHSRLVALHEKQTVELMLTDQIPDNVSGSEFGLGFSLLLF